ncbi:regulation of nuclear pre-mRNA domain-containing protein 1B-like [Tubulanus polymorphus]|uniref:regulation of nuclear pre-mRNA domain-containing protein 1B-like n=1 Tax=Tubulanus polymorphus TaxID=672921 RepID=UPI003DA41959
MASFSESSFIKKLSDFNSSQQSIQTLSLWLIHHRKHAKTIVQVWGSELQKAKPQRKLLFIYLANDVVQNSKKKGPEFHEAFTAVLPEAYKHCAREVDEKSRGSMDRMLNIWTERSIFSAQFTKSLKKILADHNKVSTTKEKEPSPPVVEKPVTKEKKKKDRKRSKEVKDSSSNSKKKKVEPSEISLYDEIENELTAQEFKEPPTMDEIKTIVTELESAPSFDAAVREKIADLPQDVSDVHALSKLKDKREADQLMNKVDDAILLLNQYNKRLNKELEDRRQAAVKLRAFINYQKSLLMSDKAKIEEYREKFSKVTNVRKELQSHIQSLPDLSLLPNITKGLAPLPSAGDLFANQ